MNIYGLNIRTYENECAPCKTKLLNWVYAHNNLENLNSFDLVGMEPAEMEILEKSTPDGIYDVNFFTHDSSTPIKAKLYWWHDEYNKLQHGLVCDINDADGNADAYNKFKERSQHCSGWTL